jgi:transcription factor IIIB 90 kDa subunit
LSADVMFGESSSGAAVLHGTLVGNNESRSRNSHMCPIADPMLTLYCVSFFSLPATHTARARPGSGLRRRGGGESHEMTLLNGRRRLHELANSQHLSELIRDAATRYFTLAVSNNFIKGRRSSYVIASCLYIACRVNQTNHMLIDFSEALQVRRRRGRARHRPRL